MNEGLIEYIRAAFGKKASINSIAYCYFLVNVGTTVSIIFRIEGIETKPRKRTVVKKTCNPSKTEEKMFYPPTFL